MMKTTFKNIVEFIENRYGEYYIPFRRNTTLEGDLGITGDEAIDFIIDFSKYFKVDVMDSIAYAAPI